MDLSIVIVNFNTKELTKQTIDAVCDTTENIEYEIIVADNSTKPHESYYEDDGRVKLIKDLPNNGFGNACNIGAARAIGRYVLFLNSDTLVQRGTLEKSVKYMDENHDVGCLGIKTILPDGTFDHGCKRGFPTPWNSLCYVLKLDRLFPDSKKFGGYRLSYLSNDKTWEVDSVSGAFMLIPRAILNKTNGFDESIFMYGEDIDLCYRIKLMGFKVVYYSDVFMIHLKGQSGLNTKNKVVIKHFHNGLRVFYDKYYKDKHSFLVTWLMHGAINVHHLMSLVRAFVLGKRL
jgi:GT2 family glycosyltransferase